MHTSSLIRGGLVALACLPVATLYAQTDTLAANAPAPLSEPAEPTFRVSSFQVEGPELVPRKQVMDLLAAFQGRLITFSELRQATESVEKLHALAGYEVVRVLVPEQDLAPDQALKLTIVDARLDEVRVSGNQFFSTELIQSQLPVLKQGALINTADMDKNLRVINENPSRAVRVTLQPSDKPLLVDAEVRVAEFEPQSYFLTLDNTGTSSTGRARLGLVAQHNNVFGLGHQLTAQALTSPSKASDVQIFGLGYKMPFSRFNGVLEFNASDSTVQVGNLRVGTSALNVAGSGTAAGVKWTHFLMRFQGLDQRLFASYDFKDFNSDVRLAGSNTSLLPNVGSRPVGVGYQLISREEVAQTFAQVAYYRNFESSGKNTQAAYSQANPFAVVDFDLFRVNATHSNQLTGDWRYNVALDAQFTSDSLISGEQFGAGGMYSVRGFDERVVSADSGARVSFEVQTGNRNGWAKDWLPRLNYVLFVDGASLKLQHAPPGVKDNPSLASVGGGVRFGFTPNQQFRLDFARVITGIPTQPSGESKVHFSFVTSL